LLARQFEAALAMLADCLRKCPEEHWDTPIAKYPFWQTAYHTLCFVDCYLTPSNEAFHALLAERAERRRPGEIDFQPTGIKELEDEYPSRRFNKPELLAYLHLCRAKAREALGDGPGAESPDTLAGPSGFSWYKVPRAELHLINLRHIQHHTGALGAALRRLGVEPRWVGSGWKE
ncbi:MAG: DinB family protein, partial [Phycisphaerales bacterium]